GVLFLVHWSVPRRLRVQAPAALIVLAVLIAGGLLAQARHQHVFGPAHPQSALQEQPYDRVEWVWSGGVTSTSARVNARISDVDAVRARLAVSRDESLSEPVFSESVGVERATNGVVSLEVRDLEPGTTYYYAVEVDGELDR